MNLPKNLLAHLSNSTRNDSPFPLYYFLVLYCNARSKDVCIEWFEGAKELIKFLGPIEKIEGIISWPSKLLTYETQELEKLLGTHQTIIASLIYKGYYNGHIKNH